MTESRTGIIPPLFSGEDPEARKDEVNVLTVTNEHTPLISQPCVFGLCPTLLQTNQPTLRTESKEN